MRGVTGPLYGVVADECYRCQPATVYEKSKLLGEQDALALSSEFGIPLIVVRPTFTYGPGDLHKLGLFRAIKNGKFVFIGSGTSVNHPVYIDDVVSGIRLALEKGRGGELYILGGDRPVSKKELVYTIADALSVKRPYFAVPRWSAQIGAVCFELLGKTFGFEPILTHSKVSILSDDFGYSIAKARNELGYLPKTDLTLGVSRTVQYYNDNDLLDRPRSKV